jgi:hypothetical protein
LIEDYGIFLAAYEAGVEIEISAVRRGRTQYFAQGQWSVVHARISKVSVDPFILPAVHFDFTDSEIRLLTDGHMATQAFVFWAVPLIGRVWTGDPNVAPDGSDCVSQKGVMP